MIETIDDITPTVLVPIVREIAAERPDHIYYQPSGVPCSYVRSAIDHTEGCIIGAALIRAGLSREYVARLDTSRSDKLPMAGPVTSILGAYVDHGDHREREALAWLAAVQGEQDWRVPWFKAVTIADIELGIA